MVLQAIAVLEIKTDKTALAVQFSIAKEMLDKKANYIASTKIQTISKARLKADKHGLESTINEIRLLDFASYTTDTIDPLQTILKQAEELLTNEEAPQAEVDQIIEQLRQAQANLVEITPRNKQNTEVSAPVNHGTASGDTTQPFLYLSIMITQVFLLYVRYRNKKREMK